MKREKKTINIQNITVLPFLLEMYRKHSGMFPLGVAVGIKTPVNFEDFSPPYFCMDYIHCKFYTGEPCLSAVYSKKQNQFIIYRTHFRSVYVPKSRFFGKNAVHCSGALLKKRKRFFLYFLNGYRYHKNFNRFEFQALKAIFSTIFKKF